jgi:hypothetical protein
MSKCLCRQPGAEQSKRGFGLEGSQLAPAHAWLCNQEERPIALSQWLSSGYYCNYLIITTLELSNFNEVQYIVQIIFFAISI